MSTDSSPNAAVPAADTNIELSRRALKGYRRLSLGVVISAANFLALLIYFQLFGGLDPHHNSISHYYHENAKIFTWDALAAYGYRGIRLGDILVGTLSAIAVFLAWFSGFSKWEDRLLSFAGTMLLGVAWIPTQTLQDPCGSTNITIHFACAVLFFLAILLVATVFAHKRDGCGALMASTPFYRGWFVISGLLMIGVPLLIWLASKIGGCGYFPDWIFWAEWTAILFFGVYWTGKMFELNRMLLSSQFGIQHEDSSWWAR